MAKKGVEFRVVWIADRGESTEAEGELNRAARDGFKVAGMTANAVILQRKFKEEEVEEEEEDDDDDED